jgi:hypothetical protein
MNVQCILVGTERVGPITEIYWKSPRCLIFQVKGIQAYISRKGPEGCI